MTGDATTGIPASDPAEIAAAHLAAGRTAEARALYEEVLRAEPTHVRALCGLGAVALRGGETARALELTGHAVAIAPDDGMSVGNLGVVYLARNELALAEDCLCRALDLAPERAELHANMASLYLARGDAAMALIAQQRAVELAAGDPAQLFNLANALVAAGRDDEAAGVYRAVLALRPGHAGALNNLSILHKQAGDLDAAAACLAEARLHDPLNPELLANHADLLLQAGRPEEALANMQRAAGLAPAHPQVRASLGAMLLELGRLAEAGAELATALRAAPSDARIAFELARLLRRQGRLDAAQAAIDRMSGPHGGGAAAEALAAELLLMRGRCDAAWERLERAAPDGGSRLPQRLAGQEIRLVAADAAASLFAARFLPLLADRGAVPTVLATPPLAALLATARGVATVLPAGHVDFAALAADGVPTLLLDELPRLLRVTPDMAPAEVFAVPPAAPPAVARGRRLIGVWWEGPGPGAALASALCGEVAGELVSLQTGAARQAGAMLLDRPDVVDRGPGIADYRDLAAEIAGLDLMIAPDGPVAHLAAGLGIETWVLLGRDFSWYWPSAADASPWYPRSRSFVQAADGSWTAALAAIRAALADLPPA